MQAFREFLGFSIGFIEILGFMVIVYFHRRSTHRIAGPIFTLENTLQEITKGKLGTRMVLRHTDHFQEVCDQVNTMTNTIERPIERSQKLARELQLATMKGEAPSQDTVDELVKELSFFTTSEKRI